MAPTLAEFRRRKKIKEEELRRTRQELASDQEDRTAQDQVDLPRRNEGADKRTVEKNPRRNESKKMNQETAVLNEKAVSKRFRPTARKRARVRDFDIVTNITADVEATFESVHPIGSKDSCAMPLSKKQKTTDFESRRERDEDDETPDISNASGIEELNGENAAEKNSTKQAIANLQTVKSKLEPTSPSANRANVMSPKKKPKSVDLNKVEIIDLMSSDDENDNDNDNDNNAGVEKNIDDDDSLQSIPLLPTIGNSSKSTSKKKSDTNRLGKAFGGLKKKISRAVRIMRAAEEDDSLMSIDVQEDSLEPAIPAVRDVNIDTTSTDVEESLTANVDGQEEDALSEIDPNAAICWSCCISLGDETPNGSCFSRAFVHSHPLLE